MMGNAWKTALYTLGSLWLFLAAPTWASGLGDASAIPHLPQHGQADYLTFAAAPQHRAFAIAPGGVWAWTSGAASEEIAELEALRTCREYTEQPCFLYALNDQVVFDAAQWLSAWDLHVDPATASVGLRRGQRFPDLALTAPDGQARTLAQLQGKPVFLHFWGSWCPPCQSEFPDLQKLYDAVSGDGIVTFALVQGRESIAKSRRWAAKRGITMELYDSGAQGHEDHFFRMADASKVNDRHLVVTYPSTYILDADGLVVFYLAGPAAHWGAYESLIRHLAAKTAP